MIDYPIDTPFVVRGAYSKPISLLIIKYHFCLTALNFIDTNKKLLYECEMPRKDESIDV